MGWPKLLVLVRHAECIGNVPPKTAAELKQRRAIPVYQYPLTPRGRRQARITGAFLRKQCDAFDACYTSYYARAAETSRILFPRATFREDPRLAELQEGIWHGIPGDMLERFFPEELRQAEAARRRREGPYHYRAPAGENCGDVETRIHSFLETVSREHAGERVLAVTHGTWLLLLERMQKGFSVREAAERIKNQDVAPNASITVYTCTHVDGKSRLFLESENIVPWQGKL